METELKMQVRPEDVVALRRHPLLDRYALDRPREQILSGIYFDTKKHDLRQADAQLRVRQVNQDWIQTLKAGGTAVAGLYERNEWESKVNGPRPDLDALCRRIDSKSRFAKLMKKLPKRGQLLPTFTTSVKRTVWDLRLPGGDEVECVIDQGNIEANDATAPVSELELELKSGDPKNLFDLALQLQQDVPMQIGNFSKADRGYDLLTPRPFVAVKATPVQLQPRMSIEEAFKTIVINCLAQIQSNQPGLFVQHDADSLHQMRVGLRRLRSALAMFEDHIACPAEIVSELRWLGLTLGAARNWDVLKASTLPGLRGLMADADILQPLHEAVENKIRLNHETVAAAAGSPRYTTLILTFLRWVEAMEWRNALSVPALRRIAKPVDNFARETIQQDQRRLKKRGRNLQAADAPTRHRLRIAVKRARYASEFFASLYPQKSVQQYVKSLALLQENLGLLNDVAVAKILMREIEASQPELRVEAAYVLGYMACRLGQDDTGLLKQWRRFKATAVPRTIRH